MCALLLAIVDASLDFRVADCRFRLILSSCFADSPPKRALVEEPFSMPGVARILSRLMLDATYAGLSLPECMLERDEGRSLVDILVCMSLSAVNLA